MSFKTIFIIVISVLVTIILMNNTDEIDFWIFGNSRIPKLTILGALFGLGLITGFLAGRPRKRVTNDRYDENISTRPTEDDLKEDSLSKEDRDYIQ